MNIINGHAAACICARDVVWGPAPFALTGKGLVASAYSTRTNGLFRTRIPP